MNKKRKLKGRKYLFFEALKANVGNITAAANKTNIDRKTHYNWLKKDENYRMHCEDLPDLEVDFYEQALRKLVKEGNTAAIIFALKCKGKNRGWVERNEQTLHIEAQGKEAIADLLAYNGNSNSTGEDKSDKKE